MRTTPLFALLLCSCASSQEAAPRPKAAPKECSAGVASTSATPEAPAFHVDSAFLTTIAETRNFRLGAPKSMVPTPDGKSVLFLRSEARKGKQQLFETDLASGTTRVLLAPEDVAKGAETLSPEEKARRERLRITATGFTSFDLDPTATKILLPISGRLFVLDRASKKVVELPTGKDAAIDPHWSPKGDRVAYVRGGDLFTIASDGKGKEVAVTKGGTEDVTHGLAEFVAQEEFDRTRGFWWSPDGASFLYEEADVTKVERLTIVDPAHPAAPPDRPSYPRAGKTNADTRFGLVSSGGGKTTWVSWDRAKYPYVVQATWPKDGPLLLRVMDRLQQHEQLLQVVDAKTGKTAPLVEESDDAWVNLDDSAPLWLPKGQGLLWSSERSGEWRLELRDTSGKFVRDLTAGLGYRELLGVDEEKLVAYVAASNEPTERWMYAIPIASGAPTRIGPTDAVTMLGHFGKSPNVYAGYEGTREGKRRWFARSVDGKLAVPIPSVAEEPNVVPSELLRVGKEEFRVAVLRPRGFVPGRKYAVIDAVYGGPHFAMVSADGATHAREQWVADATGAIVVKIDAKGTPFRGRSWERAIKNALGSVPVEGHVAALRALGEKVPEIDLERVGVFGWSFGGYFSAMAVLTHSEMYKAGVAGAAVIDWRDYDTAYTERYLGLPGDDPKIYDANDASTWAKRAISESAPVRALLVIHGTADDNVFFSNSLKLTEALALAKRPFEFLPLVGQTHQVASPSANEIVWGRTAEFLRTHLVKS
ncbi:MAG: DPP IV N-terminal domain-containing protein [Polyangiales bacterium]